MSARLTTIAALVACAALLAATAAQARSEAAPKPWVAGFCTSVLTWAQTAKTTGADLQRIATGVQKSKSFDLRTVRARFVAPLSKIAAATDQLESQLHKLGPPSVPHGADIQRQVEAAFTALGRRFHAAVKAAKALPVTNPVAFANGAIKLGKTVQGATTSLGQALSALGKYKEPQLDAAAAATPACKKVGG